MNDSNKITFMAVLVALIGLATAITTSQHYPDMGWFVGMSIFVLSGFMLGVAVGMQHERDNTGDDND